MFENQEIAKLAKDNQGKVLIGKMTPGQAAENVVDSFLKIHSNSN
jgi:hypothetical protein